MATTVRVDVFSDVICPWCYVGKRRFEEALARLGDEVRAVVTWRPFQLNPGMPPEGMARDDYRARKFGSLERSAQLDAQMTQVGREAGIDFRFDRVARIPNTFDAHRLIWLAGRRGVQDAVATALFRAFFEDGVDVGDRAALADVAASAGLDREEVARFLASDEGVEVVREEEALGRELGISGVPFFVIQDTYAISGAQPPEHFVAALREVIQRERGRLEPVGVASGAACSVDDPEACS